MGELAATIAHEVNQPLSCVLTNGNACLRWLAVGESSSPNLEEVRQSVERMIRDGQRARDVILRLRNFFKASGGEKTSLKINEVVEGIVLLVRHELDRNDVLLRTDLSERLPIVQGDSVQLQQILLNLILNAVDALAEVIGRPRELTIVTRPDSGGVRVEVRDNGVGIEKEKLESIFQPFYTTKAKGMGLGLSIRYSVRAPVGLITRQLGLSNRHGKLKGGAAGQTCFCPESAAVSFDDRTADRQSHAQAARFGCMESIKHSFHVLWIKADS